MSYPADHRLWRQRLRRPRHRPGPGARGLHDPRGSPPHRPGQQREGLRRRRPDHPDAGQPAHAQVGRMGDPRQRRRGQCRRHSLPERPPDLSGGACRRRPRHRRGGTRGRHRAAGPYLRHRRRQPQLTQPLYPVQGRGRGRDRCGLHQRHHPAAERGVRPGRRAVHAPRRHCPQGTVPAADRRLLGQGQPAFSEMSAAPWSLC